MIELYETSCSKLTDLRYKKILADVLVRNQNAFAKNKSDLGTCSVIEHKIDTAGATPIRQPVRRTPPSFEGEEEQYLTDQLEQGVIKPSKSAWAS